MDKLKQERELAEMPENVLHNAATILDAVFPASGESAVLDRKLPRRIVGQLKNLAKGMKK